MYNIYTMDIGALYIHLLLIFLFMYNISIINFCYCKLRFNMGKLFVIKLLLQLEHFTSITITLLYYTSITIIFERTIYILTDIYSYIYFYYLFRGFSQLYNRIKFSHYGKKYMTKF